MDGLERFHGLMSDLIERLKDRIEQLEEVIGVDRSMTTRIREALKLEPLKAQIVGMLLSRDFVTRDGLYTVLYAGRPECEWPDEKVLDAQICKLRPHLSAHGVEIETKWGDGWSMPSGSKTILRKLCTRGLSIDVQSQVDAVESAQIDREQFKMWGQMGGRKGSKRRMQTMNKRARQRVATHAARMRWSRRQAGK